MNPLRSISEGYKRWRHSRGFGVHSPFAYELIKSVISPGQYIYYGYRDIDMELLKPGVKVYPSLRRDARLLLRLLVNLDAKTIFIPRGSHPVFTTVAKAAGITAAASLPQRVEPGISLLLLLGNATPKGCKASETIKEGMAILALDPTPQLCDELKAAMTDGLILEGTRSLIAVPRPQMALTHYTVRM